MSASSVLHSSCDSDLCRVRFSGWLFRHPSCFSPLQLFGVRSWSTLFLLNTSSEGALSRRWLRKCSFDEESLCRPCHWSVAAGSAWETVGFCNFWILERAIHVPGDPVTYRGPVSNAHVPGDRTVSHARVPGDLGVQRRERVRPIKCGQTHRHTLPFYRDRFFFFHLLVTQKRSFLGIVVFRSDRHDVIG